MTSCKIQESKKEGKTFHKLHVLGMKADLWDRVCGLGSETWKRCELDELYFYRYICMYIDRITREKN